MFSLAQWFRSFFHNNTALVFPISAREIRPKKGTLPNRPTSLKPLPSDDTRVDANAPLATSKTVAIGGISIIGEKGYITPVITLFQIKEGNLTGWTLVTNPNNSSMHLKYFDASNESFIESYFPNTIVYFTGEVDTLTTMQNFSREELVAIARFISAFISDDGPPKEIDWS
jgi:hypothetical protein